MLVGYSRAVINPDESAAIELDLLLALGPALIALQGYGSDEVQATSARARELCDAKSVAPLRFPVIRVCLLFI